MAEVKKRKRVQLSAEEKRCFVEKIKADSSDENINSLVDEWNAEHKERRIDVFHLRRLPVPKFSAEDDFYASVATKLAIELANPVAKTSYEPRINGVDYMDRMTKRIDPDKVPDIDESTLESLRFPFENVAYNRSETEAQREASLKRLRHDFREHFNTKGLVLGRFEDFINPADRSELDRLCGPSAWIPSGVSGPWKVVGDAILKNKRILNSVKQTAVFSEQGEKEDRINPKHVTLKPLFLKYASVSDQAALSAVLRISETAYSGVADLLPTDARKNSSRRKYAINHDMDPMYLSFLSCLSVRTKVQREHMDDHERGVAGLWGLVDEEQYLIFWKHSYEMNLELEKIYEFRDFVIQKKTAGWSDDAFWNLVASIHLENEGFTTDRRPTPVKIPLRIGRLLLMDFMTVHTGMPFVPGQRSLRGHLYWAQVAGRDGELASDHTTSLWDTYHSFYPGWRVIAEHRRAFE